MHMTHLLGFGRKPFSAHKPDAVAFMRGIGSYSRIDGMTSVFRTKNGVYIAIHLQNMPKQAGENIFFNIGDKISIPLLSSEEFAYLAFYTDFFILENILCQNVLLQKKAKSLEEFELIAEGTILKNK